MNEEQDRDESDLNSFQDDLPQRPSAERQSDIDRLNIMLRTLVGV